MVVLWRGVAWLIWIKWTCRVSSGPDSSSTLQQHDTFVAGRVRLSVRNMIVEMTDQFSAISTRSSKTGRYLGVTSITTYVLFRSWLRNQIASFLGSPTRSHKIRTVLRVEETHSLSVMSYNVNGPHILDHELLTCPQTKVGRSTESKISSKNGTIIVPLYKNVKKKL